MLVFAFGIDELIGDAKRVTYGDYKSALLARLAHCSVSRRFVGLLSAPRQIQTAWGLDDGHFAKIANDDRITAGAQYVVSRVGRQTELRNRYVHG